MNLRKHDPPVLEVSNPSLVDGHHEYQIIGNDNSGPINILRRYKHFHFLREVLFKRFLGIYIPPIPEKKTIVFISYS